MSVNPFFNNIYQRNEQDLLEDLTVEIIKIHGMEIFYLPRSLVNKDRLFGEDPISAFNNNITIEMYLETVNGFNGPGDMLSKFGLQIKDSASFIVAKERFKKETGMLRPLEGDLLYLPLTKGLFEVKFVEHENYFFQNGKNHVFKLSVELFQFSEETFATGEPVIDTIGKNRQFTIYLNYGSTGANTTPFVVGSNVYQYTNGTVTGSYTGANAFGVVQSYTSTQLTVSNTIGTWYGSDTTTRYVASQDNTAYRLVTAIDDKINTDTYNDNKIIQTKTDSILDFTESNPFGTV